MSYSNFTLAQVKKDFGLEEQRENLFPHLESIPLSDWFKEVLDIGLELALSSSSEKARSEFIVVPILVELEKLHRKSFAIYSGERLDIDESKGLTGECDFILAKGPLKHTIQSPIVALVEAKKNDITAGLGQCVAQLIGAQIFNEQEGNEIKTIFGCVTTGEDWQFLKLEQNVITIDAKRYYIDSVEKILGIFQEIIRFYTEKLPSISKLG
ncbi:MAG: hypothetical protein HC877_17205 [Thioploca sp.]|nr:hypothetical protein [Thioploca sp.]